MKKASKNFYSPLLVIFITLCGPLSFIKTAEPEKNSELFQKAFITIVSNEKYQPYSLAIGDPTIAEKWIAYLKKITANLNEEECIKMVHGAVEGFLKSLEIIEPEMPTEDSNDVFYEDTNILTEKQRSRERLRHECNLTNKVNQQVRKQRIFSKNESESKRSKPTTNP